jgi:hypothetical protein
MSPSRCCTVSSSESELSRIRDRLGRNTLNANWGRASRGKGLAPGHAMGSRGGRTVDQDAEDARGRSESNSPFMAARIVWPARVR